MMSNYDPNNQQYQYYYMYYTPSQPTNPNPIFNYQPQPQLQPRQPCYPTTALPHREGACCHAPSCKYRSSCPICNPSQKNSTSQSNSSKVAKSIAKSLLKFSKQVLDPKNPTPTISTNCQNCPDPKLSNKSTISNSESSCLSCQNSTSLTSLSTHKSSIDPSAPPCLSCQDAPSSSTLTKPIEIKKEYVYDDYRRDNIYPAKTKNKKSTVIKREYVYEDANGNLIPINPSSLKKESYAHINDAIKKSQESLNSTSLYPDLRQYQKSPRVVEYILEHNDTNFVRSQSSSSLKSQTRSTNDEIEREYYLSNGSLNKTLSHSLSYQDISSNYNSTKKLPYIRNDSQTSLKSILKNKNDKTRSLEDILAQTSLKANNRSRRESITSENDASISNANSNNYRYITQMYIPSNAAAGREVLIEARIPSSKSKLHDEDDDGVPAFPLPISINQQQQQKEQTNKREYRPANTAHIQNTLADSTYKNSYKMNKNPLEPNLTFDQRPASQKALRFGTKTTFEFDN